jgi:hypothetical protein
MPMYEFINFIAAISKNQQEKVDFLKDPSNYMERRGLNPAQKKAVMSRKGNEIEKHFKTEIDNLQEEFGAMKKNRDPNLPPDLY